MGHTAVIQQISYLSQIQFIVKQQFFHPFNFEINDVLLNCCTLYLANVFSEVKGTTIQQYIINLKIERVKELLLYDELNLTQIADLLNYSSVAHLSNQFKKITGLSPSFYKQLKERRFVNLEDL